MSEFVRKTAFVHAAALAGSFACAPAAPGTGDGSGDAARVWSDAAGDASARPTGPLTGFNEGALPDLLSITLSGWQPDAPSTDPYTGQAVPGQSASIVRIDAAFAGLLNPPGPLGLGASPFDPTKFGDRPLFGFFEIDIDDRKDSGGELGDAAEQRYLANVGRFGTRPNSSFGERIARSAGDLDGDFFSGPFYERSGAEYDFGFCGCFDTALVSETGDMDGIMDAGETFVVRGRFFRRVAAFASVSGMEGGSFGGLYDPLVEVRFAHDAQSDVTTVTLVYGLDMAGAAALEGEPEQIADFLVDNHSSVVEALWDIVDGALGFNGPIGPEVRELIERWEDGEPFEELDPTDWSVTALVGTAYTTQQSALFVWSDTGFEETTGDFTGDDLADAMDRDALQSAIASLDGGPSDADGAADGAVTIQGFGPNFLWYDITGDGVIDQQDVAFFQTGSPADFDGDGAVGALDLGVLISAWGQAGSVADLDGDGIVGPADLGALLTAWGPTG